MFGWCTSGWRAAGWRTARWRRWCVARRRVVAPAGRSSCGRRIGGAGSRGLAAGRRAGGRAVAGIARGSICWCCLGVAGPTWSRLAAGVGCLRRRRRGVRCVAIWIRLTANIRRLCIICPGPTATARRALGFVHAVLRVAWRTGENITGPGCGAGAPEVHVARNQSRRMSTAHAGTEAVTDRVLIIDGGCAHRLAWKADGPSLKYAGDSDTELVSRRTARRCLGGASRWTPMIGCRNANTATRAPPAGRDLRGSRRAFTIIRR